MENRGRGGVRRAQPPRPGSYSRQVQGDPLSMSLFDLNQDLGGRVCQSGTSCITPSSPRCPRAMGMRGAVAMGMMGNVRVGPPPKDPPDFMRVECGICPNHMRC